MNDKCLIALALGAFAGYWLVYNTSVFDSLLLNVSQNKSASSPTYIGVGSQSAGGFDFGF